MKYRKKPVVIEAIQYLPGVDLYAWAWTFDGNPNVVNMAADKDGCWRIATLEGTITASPGDWVIRGVKGEFYPCKPDIFDATYEPAE